MREREREACPPPPHTHTHTHVLQIFLEAYFLGHFCYLLPACGATTCIPETYDPDCCAMDLDCIMACDRYNVNPQSQLASICL